MPRRHSGSAGNATYFRVNRLPTLRTKPHELITPRKTDSPKQPVRAHLFSVCDSAMPVFRALRERIMFLELLCVVG